MSQFVASKGKPMTVMKIACVGECMLELSSLDEDLMKRSFAGDSYNTAVYLKRQFDGQVNVSYKTALGMDTLSEQMITQFRDEDLDVSNIRRVKDRLPGLYMIETDDEGERSFSYWRNNSAARLLFKDLTAKEIAEDLNTYDLIYLSGISLAILDWEQQSSLFDALQMLIDGNGPRIAFDPNFRPALWPDREHCKQLFQRMAGLAHQCLISADDHEALFGPVSSEDIAKIWHQWGCPEVLVKGSDVSCIILHDKQFHRIAPPIIAKPVDTTGAGDSFAAGYVGGRLMGMSIEDAAKLGHRIAGQVIQHPGAIIDKNLWNKVLS